MQREEVIPSLFPGASETGSLTLFQRCFQFLFFFCPWQHPFAFVSYCSDPEEVILEKKSSDPFACKCFSLLRNI